MSYNAIKDSYTPRQVAIKDTSNPHGLGLLPLTYRQVSTRIAKKKLRVLTIKGSDKRGDRHYIKPHEVTRYKDKYINEK